MLCFVLYMFRFIHSSVINVAVQRCQRALCYYHMCHFKVPLSSLSNYDCKNLGRSARVAKMVKRSALRTENILARFSRSCVLLPWQWVLQLALRWSVDALVFAIHHLPQTRSPLWASSAATSVVAVVVTAAAVLAAPKEATRNKLVSIVSLRIPHTKLSLVGLL